MSKQSTAQPTEKIIYAQIAAWQQRSKCLKSCAENSRLNNQLDAARATNNLLITAIIGLVMMVVSLIIIVTNAGLAATL
jgi:hypothetical protein